MHLPRLRRPSRIRGGVLGIVTALILALPVGVLAGATFNDVPTTHPFYNDVEALVASGVTAGCGGGNYCPDASVTRGQMAAFMNRLGALAPGKTPVVNADKVDGQQATELALAGVRASSAGTVLTWFNHAGGEPTINKTATGVYRVTIPGRSLNVNLNFVASATVIGSTAGFATVDSLSGNVVVNTFNAAGTATDLQFMLTLVDASADG